jgi:hypothetical protein
VPVTTNWGASFFEQLADNITAGVNGMLWVGDHYASFGSIATDHVRLMGGMRAPVA